MHSALLEPHVKRNVLQMSDGDALLLRPLLPLYNLFLLLCDLCFAFGVCAVGATVTLQLQPVPPGAAAPIGSHMHLQLDLSG